jgi:hypothetical protein
MKGMLSFLEVTPAEKLDMLRRRAEVDAASVIPFPAQPENIYAPVLNETPTVGVLEAPTVGATDTRTVNESHAPTGATPAGLTDGATSTPPVVGAVARKSPTRETPTVGESQPPTVGLSNTSPTSASFSDLILELTPPPEALEVRHAKLRPVRNIQDGLTPGEFLLLTEMFKAALAEPGTKNRLLRGGGYRTLSDRTGQDPKTVKRNRNGLIAKFCIRAIGENTFTEAAQFEVLHFDNILATWRLKGLVWVRRSGRSVELHPRQNQMNTVGGTDRHTVGVLSLTPVGETDKSPVDKSVTVTGYISEARIPKTPIPGVGETPTGSIGVSPTYLSSTSNCKASSSKWPLAIRALVETTGYGDDDAVRRMAESAIANAPDATDEELAHFISEEAPRVMRNTSLDNPLGLLIRQVPRRFAGEAFRLYRESVRRQREAEHAVRQEQIAEARRILTTPSEHRAIDVQWAEQLLNDEAGKEP